jgi:hypothetical protein
VKGATDNPDISFSAASGVAPGFLRGLFEGKKGTVADVQLPEDINDDPGASKKEGTGGGGL